MRWRPAVLWVRSLSRTGVRAPAIIDRVLSGTTVSTTKIRGAPNPQRKAAVTSRDSGVSVRSFGAERRFHYENKNYFRAWGVTPVDRGGGPEMGSIPGLFPPPFISPKALVLIG